jgi:carboxyl-terminal processing protease
MYFTAADVASFNRLRYELDDRTRTGDLQPVFDIFNLFRKRAGERIDGAIALLATEPDYTLNETFEWDRKDLPWPATDSEISEVWRKNVKSDALRLILTGKTWTEAAETLKERYERPYKRITQLTTDDVFETYMNAVAHNMDPHSSYLSPRQSEEYRIQMSLSYDGIGASLQLEDDYVKIINIIPGGPAQIDGQLKPEDRITGMLFVLSTAALGLALAGRGLLSADLGLQSMAAIPPALVGMALGRWLRVRLPEARFRKVFFVALLLLGLYIVARSLW